MAVIAATISLVQTEDALAGPNEFHDISQACDDAPAADFPFVIVNPTDSWAARQTAPVATIEQALAILPPNGPRGIYLRTGVYRLNDSLVLAAEAKDLTIAACPGEVPILEASNDAPAIVLRAAERVTLDGLTFAASPSSQLRLEQSRDCVVRYNTFLNGSTPIVLAGSSVNTVQHNAIVRPSATGIELSDGSDGNIITDNIVDGAAAPETHGGGIFLHGGRDNRIAHNLIQNIAGFGIGVSNWDDTTVNVANIVEFNILRDTAISAQDSGAIYILGRSGIDTQIVIAGNVIDRTGGLGWHVIGIYLDDSTNGATVTGNLVRHAGSYAVQIHGGSDNLVSNNILDAAQSRVGAVLFQAAPADTNPLNRQVGNVVSQNVILTADPNARLFDWIDGGTPLIEKNLYASAEGTPAIPPPPVDDIDPIFAAPGAGLGAARDNYASLQAAAAVVGFRPLDFRSAGPRQRRAINKPADR